MNTSPTIGKIFGIEVELHWTFILLLVFTLLISLYVFILIVLLFICVLLHELAHSITSIRNGIKVSKIILLPIGGMSVIDDVKINPKAEFNIAIAGPIMSLFLGGVFGIITTLLQPGILLQTMQIMFLMNILLGLFNLLPAFPMDGGRVFRSFLQRKRSYYDATMLTVKVSKYLMGIILIATFVFVATGSSFSLSYREFIALWNIIIVMFLYSGAQAEAESVEIKKSTSGLHLGDAASKHFLLVKPEMSMQELYRELLEKKEHIVITRLGKAYALVELYRRGRARNAVYVKDASTPIPSLNAGMHLADALSIMQSRGSSVVAVVKGNRLIGIATPNSIESIISLHLLSKSKEGKL